MDKFDQAKPKMWSYQVKIEDKFAALENCDDSGDISRDRESVIEDIKFKQS